MPGSAPATDQDEGSRQVVISGLNHTAFDLAVYASQWRSPAPTQDSLPAAGPALPDGIGYPQGFNERFHIEMILLSRASWRKDANSLGRKPRRKWLLRSGTLQMLSPASPADHVALSQKLSVKLVRASSG